MPGSLYLRPVGLLYGGTAAEAAAAGAAGVLAGGDIAFSQVEVIERSGTVRRQMRAFGELRASGEEAIRRLLARIAEARGPLAGLSLDRPRLMGVVNVTPDSFSDGGLYDETDVAVRHAADLAGEGADIIDIGGESTRPNADPVEAEEELGRVVPVLEGLRGLGGAVLSIDTRKAAVMRAAAKAGVGIFNDVSALTHDPQSAAVAAESGLSVILMHARGEPKTMQQDPRYDDVLLDVYDYLEQRVEACLAAGIGRERLVADPGIGFGKTLTHNLALFAGLSLLHGLGVPLLVGASRKSFIGSLTGESDPLKREAGSTAAALAAVAQGAQILRVHDVRATRQAVAVWRAATAGSANI